MTLPKPRLRICNFDLLAPGILLGKGLAGVVTRIETWLAARQTDLKFLVTEE